MVVSKPAVVIGSGLAGLSCALDLAAAGWPVTVVTPGLAGLDGASSRVHRLAPWILLSAPSSRGDSPRRFLDDLLHRGGDVVRPELARVLAEGAHDTAEDLVTGLELEVLDDEAVMLPGDTLARGRRCVPHRGRALLGPLVAGCRRAGVALRERTLAVGLAVADGVVCGVAVVDREGRGPAVLPAACVVLACGGTAGLFPVTTAPRWCAGSALALASVARVGLHHPELIQWLPVAARPSGAFLGSRLLLESPAWSAGRCLPRGGDLDGMVAILREAAASGEVVELELPGMPPPGWPPSSRLASAVPWGDTVELHLAAHHGIGGVAIDEWGRTSLSGLYACGEAAGGAQGFRRTMGTGLIEARLFGRRVARAILHDASRLEAHHEGGEVLGPRPAGAFSSLDRALDRLLREVSLGGPASAILEEVRDWPAASPGCPAFGAWRAALRREAALALAGAVGGPGRKRLQ